MQNTRSYIKEALDILNYDSGESKIIASGASEEFIKNIENMAKNGEKIPADLLDDVINYFESLSDGYPQATATLEQLRKQKH